VNFNWDDPITEENRRRLIIKQNSLEDKGTHAYFRQQFAERLANAIGDRMLWKGHVESVAGLVARELIGTIDPLSQEQVTFSIERAKLAAKSDPRYLEAYGQFVRAEVIVIKLKQFINSLDSKANFILGLQGQRNAHLRLELQDDY